MVVFSYWVAVAARHSSSIATDFNTEYADGAGTAYFLGVARIYICKLICSSNTAARSVAPDRKSTTVIITLKTRELSDLSLVLIFSQKGNLPSELVKFYLLEYLGTRLKII